jgi:hypothetical protein
MSVHRQVRRFLPDRLPGWMTMLRFRSWEARRAGPDLSIGIYVWFDVTNRKNRRGPCRAIVLTGLLYGECDDIKPTLTNCQPVLVFTGRFRPSAGISLKCTESRHFQRFGVLQRDECSPMTTRSDARAPSRGSRHGAWQTIIVERGPPERLRSNQHNGSSRVMRRCHRKVHGYTS